MVKEIILQVKNRFLAGFAGLTQHLGTQPAVMLQDEQLQLVYHLPAGRLSFELDGGRDVEAFTLNLLSYSATWQPVIQLPDTTIGGVSVLELAARIEDLRYSNDLGTAAHKAVMLAIQETATAMGRQYKPEQLPIIEALAARFYGQFDFGIKNSAELRRQLMAVGAVTLLFSLTSSPRTLPLDAWYQLQRPQDKKPKKRLPERQATN